MKENIHIRLIESQRLLNFVPKLSSKKSAEVPSMGSTVSSYSDELAQLMQQKFKEYGTISQSLDRTFPIRVVKHQPSADLTDEQLHHKLSELEANRSRLIEVSLLDKSEMAVQRNMAENSRDLCAINCYKIWSQTNTLALRSLILSQ